MSNFQNQQIESLESVLSEIQKDVAEATIMASVISEKFNVVSEGIHSLSGAFTKAFKNPAAGLAVHVAGFAVDLVGKAYSSVKKEYELIKLLPKKKELASLKRNIILSHIELLYNRIPKLKQLLIIETDRPFNLNDKIKFEKTFGNDCQTAFELYVKSYHILKVCEFIIAEFDAWESDQHESEFTVPLPFQSLSHTLTEIIAPNGFLKLLLYGKNKASYFLFIKNESLLGAVYSQIYEENITEKSKNIKKIYKRKEYISLETFQIQIKKIIKKKDLEFSWIYKNSFFIEAEDRLYLNTRYFAITSFIFKRFSIIAAVLIMFLIFMSLITSNNYNDALDIISNLPFLFIYLSILFWIVSSIIYFFDWALNYGYDKNDTSFFARRPSFRIKITNFFLNLFTLGILGFAKKAYEKKELKFLTWFKQIQYIVKF